MESFRAQAGILDGPKSLLMLSSLGDFLQVNRVMGWNLKITFALTLFSISSSTIFCFDLR